MKKNSKVTNMVFVGVFAAILAVLSQISIPLPINVPVTLQTFAVALAGYFLGSKYGTVSVVVYVLLGAVGVPVFAGWKGGFSVIVGYTGGFIYGFIVMAFLCGIGTSLKLEGIKKVILSMSLGIVGLFCTHILGAFQYAHLAGLSFSKSFMTVSVPFLIKDIVSVVAAYLFSEELVKRLIKSGVHARA